jgi:hypothetical protein
MFETAAASTTGYAPGTAVTPKNNFDTRQRRKAANTGKMVNRASRSGSLFAVAIYNNCNCN